MDLDVSAAVEMLKYGVCVKECPRADPTQTIDCYTTTHIAANQGNKYIGCTYKIDSDFFSNWDLGSDELNSYKEKFGTVAESAGLEYPYRYNTKNLYGYCVPDWNVSDGASAISETIVNTFKRLFDDTVMGDKLTSYIADIAYSWRLIAICSATAVILAYLYLILIRFLGGVIIWLTIILL